MHFLGYLWSIERLSRHIENDRVKRYFAITVSLVTSSRVSLPRVNLGLAIAGVELFLLTLPALAAGYDAGLPVSYAAVRVPSRAQPWIMPHHSGERPIADSVRSSVDSVPQLESMPVIGPPRPPVPEPIVELLEAPPPVLYRNLWDRIRAGFGLRKIGGRLVAKHQAWYLKHPKHLQRMLERSERYLYFVVEELEKRNMPSEIALLPMIESAYNPHAYSPMHAAGIWQFIPATGRRYGLEQTFWYDGRRDVLAATSAALDYLQFLFDRFGDWQLALAAYNCGEGAVQRAVNYNRSHGKAVTYVSLSLPSETRDYLPKLQAMKNILGHSKLHGFRPEPIPNEPYFGVVESPGHMDVVKAAQLADMTLEEFRLLNAAYEGPAIIRTVSTQIILPIDKLDAFHAKLATNRDPLLTWQPYIVDRGETLRSVASKFKIPIDELREVNRLPARKRIAIGQVLMVPLLVRG